ncbi:hypothetical protein GIB67_010912 [Kingdonia uniflora]|uniref:Uncharacterized protein n=1 Tax=Kingdonia uniflora TaxID=39325 RepID=A0A7J7M4Z0_9MAGN|nr:hypothetical protein GIB67_010912 [Kingdonia uniflora]
MQYCQTLEFSLVPQRFIYNIVEFDNSVSVSPTVIYNIVEFDNLVTVPKTFICNIAEFDNYSSVFQYYANKITKLSNSHGTHLQVINQRKITQEITIF